MTLVLAPLLIAVSVWLYTLVFGFSALWFAHYALAALALMRGVADREAAVIDAAPPPLPPAPPPALPSPTAQPPQP
jgi:hypothetical protein